MDSTVDQLIDAAAKGDLDAVKNLLAQGADIDGKGECWNPLHAALENEQIEIVRHLIRAGADLEFTCGESSTPLRHAVDLIIDGAMQQGSPLDKCSKQLIDMFVDAGAQVAPGLEIARVYQCAVVEEHLLRRAGLMPDLEAASTIGGTIDLLDAATAASVLKRTGWKVRKSGRKGREVWGKDFEIYLDTAAKVVAYGPADHPYELVRKLTKAFDDAGVTYYFEIYDPSGNFKKSITPRESASRDAT